MGESSEGSSEVEVQLTVAFEQKAEGRRSGRGRSVEGAVGVQHQSGRRQVVAGGRSQGVEASVAHSVGASPLQRSTSAQKQLTRAGGGADLKSNLQGVCGLEGHRYGRGVVDGGVGVHRIDEQSSVREGTCCAADGGIADVAAGQLVDDGTGCPEHADGVVADGGSGHRGGTVDSRNFYG